MDVIFQPSRGNPFYVEVGYFDTIMEIKEKIQKEKGIPISKQTLLFNGTILHDDLNVHHTDILDRSRIHLHVSSDVPTANLRSDDSNIIHLLVRMPASKIPITIEMDLNDTVQRLKEKIHEMEGVAINRLMVYANGIELHDHKTIQDCELSDNAELNVAVRSSPGRTCSGNTSGVTTTKLRIFVLTKGGAEKIPLEVNFLDNVGELRKMLQKMRLDLPQEGYFFIYKQNVLDDDRSFRWHHVVQGDTIEIFSGSVSGGS